MLYFSHQHNCIEGVWQLSFQNRERVPQIGDIYMMIEVANGVTIRVDKTSIFASAEDAAQQQK